MSSESDPSEPPAPNLSSPVTNGHDDEPRPPRPRIGLGRIVLGFLEIHSQRLRGRDRRCLRRACQILLNQPEAAEFRTVETQTEADNETQLQIVPNVEIKVENIKKEVETVKQEKIEPNADVQIYIFHGRNVIQYRRPLNIPLDLVPGSDLNDPRMRILDLVKTSEMTEVNSKTYGHKPAEDTADVRMVETGNESACAPSTPKMLNVKAESIGSPEGSETNLGVVNMDICSNPEIRNSPRVVTNVPYFNPFVQPNLNVTSTTRVTSFNPFVKPK